MTVIEDRLIDFTLRHGMHSPNDKGEMCLLEAVAWVAGEPWSDHPQCVDPVLASFGRGWNDSLRTDEERTRLLTPFIPRLVGTRSTDDIQDRRAAARAAAGAAARAAARAALAPTVAELQASAVDLFDRMIALTEQP